MAYDPLDPYGVNPQPEQSSGGGGATASDPSLDWFRNWMSTHRIPASYGNAEDALPIFKNYVSQGQSEDDARLATVKYLGWDGDVAPAAAVGSGGGDGGGGGGITRPFAQQFNAPGVLDLGGPKGLEWLPPQPSVSGAPVPNLPSWSDYAPKPFSYSGFKAPSVEEAMADPGLKVGNANIQNWAAAKGTLNDSSTANALSDYAVHNYDTIRNRDFGEWNAGFGNSLQSYLTNYKTQSADPYEHAYQTALDVNAPGTSTWNAQNAMNSLGYSTTAAGAQRQNENNYSNAYNKWLADWQMFMDQRDSTFNKTLATATA